MATVTLLPLRTYPSGVHMIPSFIPPLGVQKVRMTMTRQTWPDIGGDVLRACFDLSNDGGLTWIGNGIIQDCWMGFTAAGGEIGTPLSGIEIKFPGPTSAATRIRGTIVISADLMTDITADLT